MCAGAALTGALLKISTVSSFWIWILLRTIATLCLGLLVYCPAPLKRWQIIVSVLFGQFGLAAVALVADARFELLIAAVAGPIITAIMYALMPPAAAELSFALKPARRARLMLVILGLYGLSVTVGAASTLQLVNSTVFLLFWAAGIISATVAALWWWFEYGLPLNKKMYIAGGLVFFIMAQLTWFLWWWPVGYLVNSFLTVWGWYLLWLLFRFELTAEGVNWKKQTPFLIFNFVLLALYLLFVVRWK